MYAIYDSEEQDRVCFVLCERFGCVFCHFFRNFPGKLLQGIIITYNFRGDSPYRQRALCFRKVREDLIAAGTEPEVVARPILHILMRRNTTPNYNVGHNAGFMNLLIKLLPLRVSERIEHNRGEVL